MMVWGEPYWITPSCPSGSPSVPTAICSGLPMIAVWAHFFPHLSSWEAPTCKRDLLRKLARGATIRFTSGE
jgi:hypothetical protein